jgi:hypothetical protein
MRAGAWRATRTASGPRPDGTLAAGVAASSPGDAIAFIARMWQ